MSHEERISLSPAQVKEGFAAVMKRLKELDQDETRELRGNTEHTLLGYEIYALAQQHLERGNFERGTHFLHIAVRQGIPAAQCQLQELRELHRDISSLDVVTGQPHLFEPTVDADHGGRPTPPPAALIFEAERIRLKRGGPNWTAAVVAAIIAMIGFVGFTSFNDDVGDNGSEVAEGSTPKTEKPDVPSKPGSSDSAIAAAPQDKVTVQVTAPDGRSWISAKDHNGRLLFDGFLKQGDSKTFQDKEKIDLVLGDAGALQLYVNGKKIEDEFQPGGVERLTYTKGDPE